MLKQEEILFIEKEIFSLLNYSYEGVITVVEYDGISIEGNKDAVSIGCKTKSDFARGLFLLAKGLSEGKQELNIRQKPHFKDCGVMLSLSGPGILNVKSVKQFMLNMAALGMNAILLGMDDTYPLEDYPYFGHMRGRYSKEELKEIDDYADQIGIEAIPCIQTLAHLQRYLRWEEAAPVKDTAAVLLVGEEKTYDFIRCMLQTLSGIFKSRRIHLGMDEAHSMGQGRYAKLHETVDPKQMFVEHLERVKEICREENLSPIIWSDMLFRLCGGEGGVNEEYDPKSVITEDIEKAVAGLNIMYWDYYRLEESEYDSIIKRHQAITPETSFSGGIWTWDGYLPNFKYTFDTTYPAMKACLKNGISEVYATLWDGQDTHFIHAVPGLAAFSEYCYLGEKCTEEDVLSASEFLTGIDREVLFASSEFFLGYEGAVKIGERFVDADLLFEILRYEVDYKEATRRYNKAIKILEKYPENDFAQYAIKLIEIASIKSELFSYLRPSYSKKDMNYIKKVAEEILPNLIKLYDDFFVSYEKIALNQRKPFGIELIQIRFAGIKTRLLYAQRVLLEYVQGKRDKIEELDEPALNKEHATWLGADNFMKTRL